MSPVEAQQARRCWGRRLWLAAAACFAACAIWGRLDHKEFFTAYLVAYFFWLSLGLGCLGVRMMFELTGGAWGEAVRPQLDAAVATVPWMGALFFPLLAGLRELYPWARGILKGNTGLYLNTPFFIGRAAFYFLCWTALAVGVGRLSAKELAGDKFAKEKLAFLSGPGLCLYVGTMTFASIDWAMSLTAGWYSTVYGLIWIAGQGVLAYAALILLAAWPKLAGGLFARETPGDQVLIDLGNLLLAFIILWTYMDISQLIILWSGNLPQLIPWYTSRGAGSWGVLTGFLLTFHFFFPTFILLMRSVKRKGPWLAGVAFFVILMRWTDCFWMIAPSVRPEAFHISALQLLAFAAVGGAWSALFLGAAA